MDWVSEEVEEISEKKDISKFIWRGIFGFIVIMVIALIVQTKGSSAKPVGAHVKHLLVSTQVGTQGGTAEIEQAGLERILDIKRQLDEGANFSELVAEYSDDPTTKMQGGDLGWVTRGEMTANFDAYIWRGPIGKYSDPVKSSYGYHIIYIVDRNISDAEAYQQDINRRLNELNKEKAAE